MIKAELLRYFGKQNDTPRNGSWSLCPNFKDTGLPGDQELQDVTETRFHLTAGLEL